MNRRYDRLLGDPAGRGDPLWWFEHAACRGRDRLYIAAPGPTSPAKAVCATCPVRQVCAWYAISQEFDSPEHHLPGPIALRHRYFVYGGMTPKDRYNFVMTHGVTQEQAELEYERERRAAWNDLHGI